MKIAVREESITTLEEYASISIAFEVGSILDVIATANGLGEFVLTERSLDVPYVKDYDLIDGAEPFRWAMQFDL